MKGRDLKIKSKSSVRLKKSKKGDDKQAKTSKLQDTLVTT